MNWKDKGSPTPMKFRVQQSAEKIKATVLWDSEGVLLLEFMPYKTITTGDTYASTMVALRENINQKRRGKLSAGVLLLHVNAPAHKSCTSWAAIEKCDFAELNQMSYSPDLAARDYFFFRNLKKFLRGRRIPDAVTGYFDNQNV